MSWAWWLASAMFVWPDVLSSGTAWERNAGHTVTLCSTCL
jgi:hypothetical protein